MKLNLPEVESRLAALLQRAASLLPADELADMLDLVRHGEPGVALENYCTQLHEHDVRVPSAVITEITVLGEAMGIQSRLWERLAVADKT